MGEDRRSSLGDRALPVGLRLRLRLEPLRLPLSLGLRLGLREGERWRRDFLERTRSRLRRFFFSLRRL